MSTRLAPYLTCNRILKEDWEDREYQVHVKKKKNEQKEEFHRGLHIIEARIRRKTGGPKVDNWNHDYDQRKNRDASKHRQRNDIDAENERLNKKILNARGVYDLKKWDKDYDHIHTMVMKTTDRKFYTPRGMGYRKYVSLPEVRLKATKKKASNPVKLLHQAVNKLERGDVVLMKTLVKLNYFERMETKKKYERVYEADLKKGLLKVMEKQYEPLIQALLADTDATDADRIYESLYDPTDAALIITEALIKRDEAKRKSLLDTFKEKMDSDLSIEIASKLDGDIKLFLLALLENNNLEDNSKVDEKNIKAFVKQLPKENPLNSAEFLNAVKTNSLLQLEKIMDAYQDEHGSDICSKLDANKPTVKAVKLIQAILSNRLLNDAEKLQKNFKAANKTEFIRLLATYPPGDLDQILREYNQKFQTNFDTDVRAAFSADVSRLVIKLVHRNVQSN